MNSRHISICTYFRSKIRPAPEISSFEGTDTLSGFYKALKAALKFQEYDIIHIHSIQLLGLFLIFTAITYRKYIHKTMYTIHSSYKNFKIIYRLLFIPAFLLTNRIIGCSQASYDSFPLFYKRLAGKRFHVVKNGVDVQRIDEVIGRKSQFSQNHRFTIVTVGRLIELKNPLTLLNAFYKGAVTNSKLIYMGEGALRDSIKSNTRRLKIESQVELTGLVSREELYDRLIKSDLYVSTSRIEGLPVSVLEAMVCECPVILSDIPSHREIAGELDFIPLIHPDNEVGFANEISRFSQMSKSERLTIGKKCREFVIKNLSLSAMHQGYETIYRDMLRIKKIKLDNDN